MSHAADEPPGDPPFPRVSAEEAKRIAIQRIAERMAVRAALEVGDFYGAPEHQFWVVRWSRAQDARDRGGKHRAVLGWKANGVGPELAPETTLRQTPYRTVANVHPGGSPATSAGTSRQRRISGHSGSRCGASA